MLEADSGWTHSPPELLTERTTMKNAVSPSDDLNEFIDFLFDGLEGYVYVACKTDNPDPKENWVQQFFSYPSDVGSLVETLNAVKSKYDLYIAPAIFKTDQNAHKENIKATNVVWADFDGEVPDFKEGLLSDAPPSLVIQSSTEDRIHAYWKLTEPINDATQIEEITRRITYGLNADKSGWDANQVLRPPSTYNHKYGSPQFVHTIHSNSVSYEAAVFSHLPEPLGQESKAEWQLGTLPDVQDLILRYSFPPDMVLLLKKDKDQVSNGDGKRARSLTNLAYGCAEMGMTDTEIFVMLDFAATKWDKFTGRKDRNKQLAKVVTIARAKHPAPEEDDEAFAFAYDFMSFLETDVSIEWLIEPMLMEHGSMLMVGPSGVGKTQWSLQAMIHLALGKDWLHYKIPNPKKIVFLSLEMDHGSLKVFLENMAEALEPAEKELLRANFIVVPHGEPWFLNIPEGQKHAIDLIEAVQPDMFFVDSMGSAIKGNLSSDEDIQELIGFNDKVRKYHNCSVWYIHHTRKASNGQHGSHATTQDDIYGNQYLLNRATSSYGMFRAKGGALRVKNFKNRLAPMEADYFVNRVDHLNFEISSSVKSEPEVISYTKPEHEKGPTAGGFEL